MENALHRFVRLLRLRQVRISIPEALDAMACAAQPGMLHDREQLRAALRVALIKDRRDEEVFDEIFDQFFALVKVGSRDAGHGHGHGHEDLSDEGALEDFTLSEEPSDTPQQGHSHGKPVDIRDYFNPEDLAQQYNLHQEANKIDLAAMTEEIVLSKENTANQASEGNRVQIETDHLSYAGSPGQIAQQQGTKVDADLSVTEQEALLGWLNDVEGEVGNEGTEDDAAALRRRLSGVLAGLPEAIKRHLEALLALEQRIVESSERAVAQVDRVGEHERMELEESLRRLAHSLHGGLTHKRRVAASGRIDSGRTMRRNMRFDGIPFSPVTVRRAEDKPRLVVLTDVSLSVRATARFTLHLVHGLQNLFGQV
ncbi:MAG: VWA domain-containing protein, partial [Actinomycetota bacterium]|nr:VWA domain-containing protein [Actinomycetota bacterium]